MAWRGPRCRSSSTRSQYASACRSSRVERAELSRKLTRTRSKTREELTWELREQEARRIWRVLHWGLKARMVSIDEGVETFEQAFLPHIVNPATDRTIFEDLASNGSIELPGSVRLLPAGDG